MPCKKYYDDNIIYSDSEDSVQSIDEKVQKFTLKDYLNFPPTKEIIEAFHYQDFLDKAEPELKNMLDEVYDYSEKQMASLLRLDWSNKGKGIIVGMIYNHIEKEYTTTIFEDYPELAKPLFAAEKEKKNNN